MRLGFFQCFFGVGGEFGQRQAGFADGDAGAEGDVFVCRDVFAKMGAHVGGEVLDLLPRADEEEIIATGEDGVAVRVFGGAVSGQPQAEELVHLPREGGHFGEGRRAQAAFEDFAEVVHVAFESGEGDFAAVVAIFVGMAFFAGEMVEGFDLSRWSVVSFFFG